MKQSHRLALQAVDDVLGVAGVPYRPVQGAKHLCVIVTGPDGEEHKLTLAGSPRDGDHAQDHIRQNCQRLLERIGIGFHRGVRRGNRRDRRHGRQASRATVLTFDRPEHDKGPYRDPWEKLRAAPPG